jgi:hypothetical protein
MLGDLLAEYNNPSLTEKERKQFEQKMRRAHPLDPRIDLLLNLSNSLGGEVTVVDLPRNDPYHEQMRCGYIGLQDPWRMTVGNHKININDHIVALQALSGGRNSQGGPIVVRQHRVAEMLNEKIFTWAFGTLARPAVRMKMAGSAGCRVFLICPPTDTWIAQALREIMSPGYVEFFNFGNEPDLTLAARATKFSPTTKAAMLLAAGQDPQSSQFRLVATRSLAETLMIMKLGICSYTETIRHPDPGQPSYRLNDATIRRLNRLQEDGLEKLCKWLRSGKAPNTDKMDQLLGLSKR